MKKEIYKAADRNITKFTDIGKVLGEWEVKELHYFFDYIQPTEFICDSFEENKTDINYIPVLTAGKSFILGYTNSNGKTFSQSPVILFDDFTTVSKYVDFSFQVRSSAVKILIPKKSIDFDLMFVFNTLQQINFVSTDHKRYWISEYQFLKIPTPPLREQKKISLIISTWDDAIRNCNAILLQLKKRKQWLAFELIINNKQRVKGMDIKVLPLSKLLNKIKKPFTPVSEKLYKQIGIRSHAKGIFYKDEMTGKNLGSKSVFHIEPDCFIVNIVFAWEHAIAKTTINEVGMIASHRFPMFKPNKGLLDLDYLLHYFKSERGKELLKLASPGGAGRNKTLNQNEFLKLQIPIPSFEKQKLIAGVLDKADYEILVYQQKLKRLQLQKKGLMQKLLTGKVRVKL